MYAQRKSWSLQDLTVRLRHSRIHTEDCAECETKEGKIDRIELGIEFAGPLSSEQRSKLLEIARNARSIEPSPQRETSKPGLPDKSVKPWVAEKKYRVVTNS
jgi:uncharacterized OsmC-like protein